MSHNGGVKGYGYEPKCHGGVKGYEPQCPSVLSWDPDSYEPHLNIENVCQGITPLHLACSTGIQDCVQLLHSKGARFCITDHSHPPRGPLQMAEACQRGGQRLASWIRANVRDWAVTTGMGRKRDRRTTGTFSKEFRMNTRPANHRDN